MAGFVQWRHAALLVADGSEIFYAEDRAIVAVRVSRGNELTFGEPQRLFESPAQIGAYAAFPDGQRFIMFRRGDHWNRRHGSHRRELGRAFTRPRRDRAALLPKQRK